MNANYSHWNTLINVRANFVGGNSEQIKSHAQMLLSQLNTASGDRVKNEIDIF